MRTVGKYSGTLHDRDGRCLVQISIEDPEAVHEIEQFGDKDLLFEFELLRGGRSLRANRLLWKCLGQLATALRSDKWSVYLLMLKRYGKSSYILVNPIAVNAMKAQWREIEEIGEVEVNGRKAVQLLCYYGSHTYDTKEFSVLLDGVISEMNEVGIKLPPPQEVEEVLKEWEKQYG